MLQHGRVSAVCWVHLVQTLTKKKGDFEGYPWANTQNTTKNFWVSKQSLKAGSWFILRFSSFSKGTVRFLFKARDPNMALLRAGLSLCALVSGQRTDFVRWRLTFRGSLAVHREHSTQSLHHAPTPSHLYALSLILQFSLLSFWNANAYKLLFLCSWHHSLLSSNCRELWHKGCILCWTPGSDRVMTEMWVILQRSYCNRLSLITLECL